MKLRSKSLGFEPLTTRRPTRAVFRRHCVAVAWLLCVALASPLVASAQEDIPEVVRTLIEQADRDRDRNRVEDAITKYREVIKQAPGVAQAYVSLGGLYHRQGKLQDAL